MANEIVKNGVLDWISTKNKAIKLVGDTVVYKLADAVNALNHKGLGIVKGAKIELKLADDMVVFIKGDKSAAKPESTQTSNSEAPKQETKKEPESKPVNGRRIKAIAAEKNFLKFDDAPNWFGLSDEVQKMVIENTSIRAGAVVQVEVETIEDEPIIKALKLIVMEPVKQEAPKQTPQPEQKSEAKSDAPKTESAPVAKVEPAKKQYNSYDNPEKQNSIEVQSCINRAVELTIASLDHRASSSVITNEDIIKDVEYFTKEIIRILKTSK